MPDLRDAVLFKYGDTAHMFRQFPLEDNCTQLYTQKESCVKNEKRELERELQTA